MTFDGLTMAPLPEVSTTTDETYAGEMAQRVTDSSEEVSISELFPGAPIYSRPSDFGIISDNSKDYPNKELTDEETFQNLTKVREALNNARHYSVVGKYEGTFDELSSAAFLLGELGNHHKPRGYEGTITQSWKELAEITSSLYPEGGCQRNPTCGLSCKLD